MERKIIKPMNICDLITLEEFSNFFVEVVVKIIPHCAETATNAMTNITFPKFSFFLRWDKKILITKNTFCKSNLLE